MNSSFPDAPAAFGCNAGSPPSRDFSRFFLMTTDDACRYAVEVEKNADNPKSDDEVAAELSAALKARIGVKPAKVKIHPDGGLDTRSEHKSKRIIDERNPEYSI